MTREDLCRKNQQLSTEFELYLLEHPEIEEQIPDNAMIVLVPEYDQELATKNIELAEANPTFAIRWGREPEVLINQ